MNLPGGAAQDKIYEGIINLTQLESKDFIDDLQAVA
jgi:hypothetical protein